MISALTRPAIAIAGAALALAPALPAQETGDPLPVGARAPDFALVGASSEGVLDDSIRPSDFRGHTLVIALFFRARSSG